jgi:two-component system, NarL family, nitrate/nitrite response regulator NarL
MPERISIVIADDHPMFRDGVRRTLEDVADFHVTGETADGIEALRLVAQKEPDLLLLDIALPDVSGVEVLRRLREAGSATRTLLLTAAVSRPQLLQCLELGARGVVMKEAAGELLAKAIRTVAKGEFWIGREAVSDWEGYQKRHRVLPRQTLTAREHEIIAKVLQGYTNRETGQELKISEETVKSHLSSIFRKLGVSNRMELALYVSSGKLDQPF